MLDQPFPASWTVRRARDAYLAENGFSVASYDDAWTEASFLGIPFKVPNTPRHRWAIMLHDLHHVATGYGTDLAGEGEVSLWEARRGLAPLGVYVASIVTAGSLLGAAIAPGRALAAWRASGAAATSLFASEASTAAYDRLLDLTVSDLRAQLGIPAQGLTRARALHSRAPSVLAS